MKVNGTDLFKIIREVVKDEIRKSLPEIVRAHLTESYLKKMVLENTKDTRMSEVLDPEELEEETPEPLRNDNEGIYNKSPLLKNTNESRSVVSRLVRKNSLTSEENPLSFLYEGLEPIPEGSTAAPSTGGGVPLDALNIDPRVMKTLAGVSKKSNQPKTGNSTEEERIRMSRERLNKMVVGD
jgi:hypothetical protein